MVVGGDSAGGNLTAGVSCKAPPINCFHLSRNIDIFFFSVLAKQRNQLEHPIKHQILYYPCVDNDTENESYIKYREGFFFTKKMADHFLACHVLDKDHENMLMFPNKAPIEDLVGLPPVLLVTCEADVLREGKKFDVRKHRILTE